ncbi:MAG: DUF2975 domain-containing protein [Oscillospiraceae bacterium]
MKKNISSKEKIRRMSAVASVVLIIYMAVFVYGSFGAAFMKGFIDGLNGVEYETESDGVLVDVIVPITAIALIVFFTVSAYRLLKSMKTDESPFTEINGIRIRNMGLALIFEELMETAVAIGSSIADGESYISGMPMGFGIMAGLILYCVSLVFRYGCELQQESDETL